MSFFKTTHSKKLILANNIQYLECLFPADKKTREHFIFLTIHYLVSNSKRNVETGLWYGADDLLKSFLPCV